MNASKLAEIRANATLKCASHPRQTPRMLYAISTHRTTSQLRDDDIERLGNLLKDEIAVVV